MVVVFCAGHKHRIHCSEGSIWLEYYSISTAAARREREVGVADAVTNTNRPSGQHREHQIKLPKATRCTNTDTRLFVSDVKSAELSVQEVCQCAPNKIELYFVQSHFSLFKHSRGLQGTNFRPTNANVLSQRYKHGHTHTSTLGWSCTEPHTEIIPGWWLRVHRTSFEGTIPTAAKRDEPMPMAKLAGQVVFKSAGPSHA